MHFACNPKHDNNSHSKTAVCVENASNFSVFIHFRLNL